MGSMLPYIAAPWILWVEFAKPCVTTRVSHGHSSVLRPSPLSFCASAEAPDFSSSSTTSTWPFPAAESRGVLPRPRRCKNLWRCNEVRREGADLRHHADGRKQLNYFVFFPMWRLMLKTISIFSHQSDRTSNCSTSEPHQAPTFQGSGHIYCRHPLWLSQQSTSQPRQRGRSAPPNAALCRLGRAQWASVGKGLGPVVPTENAKITWKREDSFKNKTLFRCTRPFPYDHP